MGADFAAPRPAIAVRDLVEVLACRLSPPARAWLDDELETLETEDPSNFSLTFAVAAQRVGWALVRADTAEQRLLERNGLPPSRPWRVDELARITLLLALADRRPDSLHGAVEDAYRYGETRERQAILRALPLLPGAKRFLPLTFDASRTHVQPLFESLACENGYPAGHFPDAPFAHLVLKAVFLGIPLRRIVALGSRLTPELARMAGDYVSERRAAGRAVPDDIALLLTGHAGPE